MEDIRISRVDNVTLTKQNVPRVGTLHLTAHHLIFCARAATSDEAEKEEWIPYPLITLVTKLPVALAGAAPITLNTRTFLTYHFVLPNAQIADDVFESIKSLSVVDSVTQLYAFFATSNSDKGKAVTFNPRDEFTRMGVGTRTKAWRFTDINKEYAFCSTYPALLCVPTRISDTTLSYASKYRTKQRIPALTYLHWSNLATITRSSQPMVGLTNSRSIQDEKLIEAIFTSHTPSSVRMPQTTSPTDSPPPQPQIYGATPQSLIIDARPTKNAFANNLKGAGSENMEYYPSAKKAYLGVDNIHIMRDSIRAVDTVLRECEVLESQLFSERGTTAGAWVDRSALRRTGWLKHLSSLLEGALLIVRTVHVSASHVLIHCSDGWDRTSQLSALAQLCLDPYYRTIDGFERLVEKDFVGFGHKFCERCGHLGADKSFVVAPPTHITSPPDGSPNINQAQAFLASVQQRLSSGQSPSHPRYKETSPVFHQFLECVYNLCRQYPTRFEYNENFLRTMYEEVYECRWGTFLFDSVRDRTLHADRLGRSFWEWIREDDDRMKGFKNEGYDPSLDDPLRTQSEGRYGDMGVLLPDARDVAFWCELYRRDGMNPPPSTNAPLDKESIAIGVERPTSTPPASSDGRYSLTADLNDRSSRSASSSIPPSPVPSPSPGSRPEMLSKSLSAVPSSSQSSVPSSITPNTSVVTGLADLNIRPDPLDNEGSAFSMKTQRQKRYNAGSSISTSPIAPTRSLSTNLESRGYEESSQSLSNNMKNIWGLISSNSNTVFNNALNKVQEAYEDFKSTQEGGMPADRELRATISTSSAPAGEVESWSTMSATSVRSLRAEDNPWTTSRPGPRAGDRPRPRVDELFTQPAPSVGEETTPQRVSTLPLDPTITVDPLNPWSTTYTEKSRSPSGTLRSNAGVMQPTVTSTTRNPSQTTVTSKSSPSEAQQQSESASHNSLEQSQSSDPLGIASWN